MSDFRLDPELLADSGLGVVVYTPTSEARIECCNSLAARWFGCTRAELEGRAALDLAWSFLDAEQRPLPREDLPVFEALALGKAVRNVPLGILAAGKTAPVWVRVCAVPQRGAGGEIERVVTTLAETTAEVNARKVAAPMSHLMEVAFESAHEGLFVSNADGSVIKFNAAYGRLSRISPTEGITSLAALRRVVSAIDVNGEPMAVENWPLARALRGETGEVEARAHRPGTDNIWIGMYRYAPLRDAGGSIAGAVIVCRDITGKRALETALTVSERRFKALVDGAPDGVFISSNGAFTYVNSALLKLIGLTHSAELSGTSIHDWVPSKYSEACQQMKQRVMKGEVLPPSFREVLRRDGLRVPVETTGAMLDQNSYVGFVRDVSARVAAAAEESKLRDELERTRRMDSMGTLAGGLAHDFNNILQAQKLFLALMRAQLSTPVEAALMLENIESCTDKASTLVRQLLAFGRKQIGNPSVVDLNAVLLSNGDLLKSAVGENVIFQITPAPAPLWVDVDAGQIGQIMLNLALNARDAMPEGGQLQIRLSVEANDLGDPPQALILVIDTGVGIDDAARLHIFEPFFTTKPNTHPGGLGLASVYALVEQNSGLISVSSRLGDGTQFEIRLPLVLDQTRQDTAPDAHEQPLLARQSHRILLVEDDPSLREATRRVLEQQGHQVVEAANGSAALLLVEQLPLPPQLLITDLIMPRMNGRVLAERLRERFRDLRIIFISGHSKGLISHNGVLESDLNFLAKPFSTEQLQRMIAQLGGEGGGPTADGPANLTANLEQPPS